MTALYDPDLALTRPWTIVGGIRRWTGNRPADEPIPLRDQLDAIACPTCHALTNEPCRTNGGHYARYHKDRRGVRSCLCGTELGLRKQGQCQACAKGASA